MLGGDTRSAWFLVALAAAMALTAAAGPAAAPPPSCAGPDCPCPSCRPGPAPYPTTQPCSMAPLRGTPACDHNRGLEERVDDIANRIPLDELPNLFSDVTTGVPSLNIPQYNWWSEALHGVSRCAYDKTDTAPGFTHGQCCWKGVCPSSFPAGITTGSSFNKTLFRKIGTAVGTEARVMSNVGQASLTFWTPNVRATLPRAPGVWLCACAPPAPHPKHTKTQKHTHRNTETQKHTHTHTHTHTRARVLFTTRPFLPFLLPAGERVP